MKHMKLKGEKTFYYSSFNRCNDTRQKQGKKWQPKTGEAQHSSPNHLATPCGRKWNFFLNKMSSNTSDITLKILNTKCKIIAEMQAKKTANDKYNAF